MRAYLTVLLFCFYSCNSTVDYPLKGHSYPTSLSTADTANYIFPLKDSLSQRDSLTYTNYYNQIFTAFGEPNLSIKPQAQPVYRLLYGSVMDRPIVVTLRENQIVIKEQTKGYSSPYYDTAKLSPLERLHFEVLRDHFPVQEASWRKQYVDSLVRLYPQLLNVSYYQTLRNKAMTFGNEAFAYKTEIIPILKSTYARLANDINRSDFWDEPYQRECNNPPNDGFGFTLEVNTPQRYKVVSTSFCPGYSRSLHKAWQKLADFIKRGDRLNLVWDKYELKN